MNRITRSAFFVATAALALASAGLATAKLPDPSPEAKAKAAEAAARTAWSNQVANYQLCQSMDRVAARYQEQARAGGKEVKAPTQTPPCSDPGQFTYVAPDAKPLEAAGAHSPPTTAATPPNSAAPSATQDNASKPKP
jgi:hypothetical protein